MSSEQPRVSSAKVVLAILAAMALSFSGCALFATDGRAFEVRGTWELFAAVCLVFAGLLVVWLYRLAFKTKPAFFLHDDRVEHFSWKQPIYFRDIEEVVFEPRSWWPQHAAEVRLRLRNGTIQYVPYSLMTHEPAEFAELLKTAIDQHRTAAGPEQRAEGQA